MKYSMMKTFAFKYKTKVYKIDVYKRQMQDGEDYRKYLMKKITYGRMNIEK